MNSYLVDVCSDDLNASLYPRCCVREGIRNANLDFIVPGVAAPKPPSGAAGYIAIGVIVLLLIALVLAVVFLHKTGRLPATIAAVKRAMRSATGGKPAGRGAAAGTGGGTAMRASATGSRSRAQSAAPRGGTAGAV